ncbi:UDP-N-acetylglucosamine 2-epimerase [Vibrio aerogenes CECT 7868]|uniref:UDP-N-acetylglucosamine 2-epimerase (non-hydrolyzing) n=1 Tax=Vibrio aerogenes CECT 7868 TaxID=1216006 RepID=A0A1M5UHS3_9VIBR|nr:UDP-N-acetylglucosamine 2-epimerase (non-hydrolyzing) [Vibrio aerogenes]SHH62565.1 UDP-N-acetylglucosamine 2-epimerase [Vibrio aerogenes CECT 7868]
MNPNRDKALLITGTRPEIIKMVPLYHALKQVMSVTWCHTGQHDALAGQTFSSFHVTPDIVFTRPAGTRLPDLLAGLILNIGQVLAGEKYDALLVQGDTCSTLAGAIAGFYEQVPLIGHIEAGLRSGDLYHPFPEEMNRISVSRYANRHYVPTAQARRHLLDEGITDESIIVTGNTVIDTQHYLMEQQLIDTAKENKVLVTCHRRENWPYIQTICQAIGQLSARCPELEFVFSVHPNPDIRDQVYEFFAGSEVVRVVDALDYIELQKVLAKSVLVMTDSGGIQEEAPTYGVRIVVLRETTERPEVLDQDRAVLTGASDIERILDGAAQQLMRGSYSLKDNPFGHGDASERITEDILRACHESV